VIGELSRSRQGLSGKYAVKKQVVSLFGDARSGIDISGLSGNGYDGHVYAATSINDNVHFVDVMTTQDVEIGVSVVVATSGPGIASRVKLFRQTLDLEGDGDFIGPYSISVPVTTLTAMSVQGNNGFDYLAHINLAGASDHCLATSIGLLNNVTVIADRDPTLKSSSGDANGGVATRTALLIVLAGLVSITGLILAAQMMRSMRRPLNGSHAIANHQKTAAYTPYNIRPSNIENTWHTRRDQTTHQLARRDRAADQNGPLRVNFARGVSMVDAAGTYWSAMAHAPSPQNVDSRSRLETTRVGRVAPPYVPTMAYCHAIESDSKQAWVDRGIASRAPIPSAYRPDSVAPSKSADCVYNQRRSAAYTPYDEPAEMMTSHNPLLSPID
jgi:hypothetical protein